MFPFKRKKAWPALTLDEIRKRARLVVIDDAAFPYDALFSRDGYNLEKWDDVNDLPKLESGYYDVILLDLQGVGQKESSEQGLGVLKHLRKRSPAQVIVAFSEADWPVKYKHFFDMADAVLPKNADYVDFKQQVDNLLLEHFSIGFYLAKTRNAASAYPALIPEIESRMNKAILTRQSGDLGDFLKKKQVDPQTLQSILSIANFAMEVMKAWQAQS